MTQLEQLTGDHPRVHFDYGTLGAGVREEVTKATTNIRKRARRMATDILEIGLEARRVKSYLDHGQFVQWVETEFAEEFGWSYQSVMRFVQVSEHFSQTSQIERFGKSALYLLSQTNTPESAREEARERADAGEQITHQAAKEIMQRHRQPEPEPPSEPHPLPHDLLKELSRLGWELRSSRVSPMGLHLYTLADDGGRGATEERSRDGWEQMRDDLQADEQRRLMMRIRVIVQRLHQEDRSQEAYELIRGITDNRQREALQADVDEGLARAKDPAKCREYDEQADAHLLEPEQQVVDLERQQAAYRAVHRTILSMTEQQRRLLALAFGCEYIGVVDWVWDRVKGQVLKDEVCKLVEGL